MRLSCPLIVQIFEPSHYFQFQKFYRNQFGHVAVEHLWAIR